MSEDTQMPEEEAGADDAARARVEALGQRISAALGRVVRTVRTAPVGDGDRAEEIRELERQLKRERELAEELRQWAERLKHRLRRMSRRYEARLKRLADRIEAQSEEIRRLRDANRALTEELAGLREAAAGGAVDAERINRAMETEIRAMQAARASEIAEIDHLMAELRPLMQEKAAAAEGAPARAEEAQDG